jgi:hypothetical protein
MKEFLALILILIIFGLLWSLPLWLVINFTCWVFHLSFNLTLLQAFAICLLASVIKNLLFKKEGDK